MRQIQSILRNVSDGGSRAALYYDGGQDFIITSLLDVGEKGLWVEQGADVSKNRHIAESKRITLVSYIDQVKIQFIADAAKAVTHQGYPAFFLALPSHIYRIQRREYFRLSVPVTERLRCIIPQAGGKLELPVMDISGGGIRLSCAESNIEFVLGQTYAGCQIDLPEIGKISVTITVKSAVSTSPKPGQTIQYLGCEFKNLDNASGVLLQRYVTRMQRLRNDPQ